MEILITKEGGEINASMKNGTSVEYIAAIIQTADHVTKKVMGVSLIDLLQAYAAFKENDLAEMLEKLQKATENAIEEDE